MTPIDDKSESAWRKEGRKLIDWTPSGWRDRWHHPVDHPLDLPKRYPDRHTTPVYPVYRLDQTAPAKESRP